MVRKLTFFVVCLCAFITIQAADDVAAKQKKAVDLVKKVIAFYETNGKDKTIETINNPKSQFVDGSFYTFLFDFTGLSIANGGNSKLINKMEIDLVDANGKEFIKEFIRVAKESGSGFVDYDWSNPTTKKIQHKTTYIERIPNTELFVGSGFYKD